MSELILPESASRLRDHLATLRESRRSRQASRQNSTTQRKKLSALSRKHILGKADGRCHICGGEIKDASWQADHVLAHGDGGNDSLENFLPAHRLCNAYRWDYSPEEFQWIMKIGIWARKQMESSSASAAAMLEEFFRYETRRHQRRKN